MISSYKLVDIFSKIFLNLFLIEENVVICSKAPHIYRPFVVGVAFVDTGVTL